MKTQRDPRLDRSRAAILSAAVELLSEGGVQRVTIEAVTARSGVARSTLYRHFRNNTELLAAAFRELLPPLPEPDPALPARDRLLQLVLDQADQIAHVPAMAAVTWMAASGYSAETPSAGERTRLDALRQHIIDNYRRPFDPVLTECLSDSEREIDLALARLIGPLVFNALVTGRPNDREFCTRLVDEFLAATARSR
ncbi:TetR/AcrR family transcriptional regulator [Amycolatopsis sp. K13G38]|uniref:TetR/AcrR family transcriptional regulator n=1 Tax=Amycolatopsis acididurans TaxID=2724524 RepID=A0ABX1JH26_9PSEU|nr:TetR/AcrR family transcriptional regulator [Amycolatopsis acididurans]NKQ58134.1 TetR/AcrR family transcriptional regulator [Amycolatopsis acididurans]